MLRHNFPPTFLQVRSSNFYPFGRNSAAKVGKNARLYLILWKKLTIKAYFNSRNKEIHLSRAQKEAKITAPPITQPSFWHTCFAQIPITESNPLFLPCLSGPYVKYLQFPKWRLVVPYTSILNSKKTVLAVLHSQPFGTSENHKHFTNAVKRPLCFLFVSICQRKPYTIPVECSNPLASTPPQSLFVCN